MKRVRVRQNFLSLFHLAGIMVLFAGAAVIASASSAYAQYTAPLPVGGRLSTRGDGTIVMFARGQDQGLYFGQRIGFTGTGKNMWTGWQALGGILNSQPVGVMNNDSRMLVVVRGSDNRLYEQREISAGSRTFGGWVQIPPLDAAGGGVPAFVADPAVVRVLGRLAVFAVATDGSLWEVRQTSQGGAFGRYTRIGRPASPLAANSPVISLNANGGLILFAYSRDSSGTRTVWSIIQPPGGSWGGWISLGSGVNASGSNDRLFSGVNSNGRVSVFMNNNAATISVRTQTSPSSSTFTAWSNLLGGAHGNSRATAVRNSDGRLSVFFFATSGSPTGPLHWQSQTAASATTWNNWSLVQTGVGSPPVAITDVNGRIHVLTLDSSGSVHEQVQTTSNASTFTSWNEGNLGGSFSGL